MLFAAFALFMFLLSVLKMDFLLLEGCYSVTHFVLTMTSHKYQEGGKAQIPKSPEFLVLLQAVTVHLTVTVTF